MPRCYQFPVHSNPGLPLHPACWQTAPVSGNALYTFSSFMLTLCNFAGIQCIFRGIKSADFTTTCPFGIGITSVMVSSTWKSVTNLSLYFKLEATNYWVPRLQRHHLLGTTSMTSTLTGHHVYDVPVFDAVEGDVSAALYQCAPIQPAGGIPPRSSAALQLQATLPDTGIRGDLQLQTGSL